MRVDKWQRRRLSATACQPFRIRGLRLLLAMTVLKSRQALDISCLCRDMPFRLKWLIFNIFFSFLTDIQDWHSTCFIPIRPSAFEKCRSCTIARLWMYSQWFADPSSIIFLSKSVCLRTHCSRMIFEQHGLLKRARSQAICCCDHAKPPVFQLHVFWRGVNR